VKAIDPSGDQPLFTRGVTASDKDEVLAAVGSLAAKVRKALGDTSEGADAGRETSFTAASLEAARSYTVAQDLADSYRDAEAIEHYQRAIDEDPNFGRAYAGWANCAFRLGRTKESEGAWEKALALVERMTEREKYRPGPLLLTHPHEEGDRELPNPPEHLSRGRHRTQQPRDVVLQPAPLR
jgi:tetratricopeptide (TPR) repeat protein